MLNRPTFGGHIISYDFLVSLISYALNLNQNKQSRWLQKVSYPNDKQRYNYCEYWEKVVH